MLNRLIHVTKNGTIVAEYGYDPGGVRAVKKVYQNGVNTDKIHYVFEGTEPIFEKRISDSRVRSYIYALGRYLARVDGVIGDSQAKVYHYHADYAGSIKAVTDQAGRIVYNADYLPFGTQISKSGDFDELRGFTGKEYDPDIGLYYFNARWYDPELGRFISEDPAADPNNCNLYSYCGNNPIMRADPTGKFWLTLLISALAGGISSASNGGNFMEGFILGGLGACMGYGISSVLSGMGSFGAATLGGGLSGGIMGALQGGDFWSSFGTGLFSAGVTFGLDRLIKTDNIFISNDKVEQALLSGFKMELRSLITSGKGISFLDFIEELCKDYDAYRENTTLISDGIDSEEIKRYIEKELKVEISDLNIQQVSFTTTNTDSQSNYKVAIKLVTASGQIITGYINVLTGTISILTDPSKLSTALATSRIVFGGYKIVNGVRTIFLEIKSIVGNSLSGVNSPFGGGGAGGGWGEEYEVIKETKMELFKWGFNGIMDAWDNGRLSKADAWGAVVIWGKFLNDVFDFGNEGYLYNALYKASTPEI